MRVLHPCTAVMSPARLFPATALTAAVLFLIGAVGCTNVGEERIEQTRQLDPYAVDPEAALWMQPLALLEDAQATERLRGQLKRLGDDRALDQHIAASTRSALASTGTLAVARGDIVTVFPARPALLNAKGEGTGWHATAVELVHQGGCHALAISPDGRTVAAVGAQSVRAWRFGSVPGNGDPTMPAPYSLTLSVPAIDARDATATCATFSPNGDWLLIGYECAPERPQTTELLVGASTPSDDRRAAGFLALWRITPATQEHHPSMPIARPSACIPTHERITSLAIDGAGRWVLAGAPNALSLWRLVTDDLGGLVRTSATPWPTERGTPAALTFVEGPRGSLLSAGLCVVGTGADARVVALPFMADTGRAETAWLQAARVAPEVPRSTAPLVYLGNEIVAEWRGTPAGHDLDTAGRWLFAADAEHAQLWRVGAADRPYATCVAKVAGHLGPVIAVAVSPDGRLAATTDALGVTRVWRSSSPPALEPAP